MPNDKQLFKLFFNVKTFGKTPSRSRYSLNHGFNGGYLELNKNKNLLYVEDEFDRKVLKQAYLKSKHNIYHIITKRDLTKSILLTEFTELFDVQLFDF